MQESPISLYIHMPWCIKKCPYCDFNSHALKGDLPENEYIQALLSDLDHDLTWMQMHRPIQSIFIGGGTPSLFSPSSIHTLLHAVQKRLPFQKNIEITLEANPGTLEFHPFNAYYDAGINRVSLGVQSFQDDKLKELGRIHSSINAKNVLNQLKNSRIRNFNIDLMFGLPNQTLQDALYDLKTAIQCSPQHLSWYQLTLEPNTIFHKYPPILPQDDTIFEIYQQGKNLLAKHNYIQYEVSAYATSKFQCQHNLNYWQFGDYLAIGAGAHGKISLKEGIIRFHKTRNPLTYLNPNKPYLVKKQLLSQDDIIFEFMLNYLRLLQGFSLKQFENATQLNAGILSNQLQQASKLGFLSIDKDCVTTTEKGKLFLNDCLSLFLP